LVSRLVRVFTMIMFRNECGQNRDIGGPDAAELGMG
jgi:hypothetical protein